MKRHDKETLPKWRLKENGLFIALAFAYAGLNEILVFLVTKEIEYIILAGILFLKSSPIGNDTRIGMRNNEIVIMTYVAHFLLATFSWIHIESVWIIFVYVGELCLTGLLYFFFRRKVFKRKGKR